MAGPRNRHASEFANSLTAPAANLLGKSLILPLLASSVKVVRNGRAIKMHPYEAMLFAEARQALAGKIRSLRQILKEFKIAGLLEAPLWQQSSGVLVVAKGVPMQLAPRLRSVGRDTAVGS